MNKKHVKLMNYFFKILLVTGTIGWPLIFVSAETGDAGESINLTTAEKQSLTTIEKKPDDIVKIDDSQLITDEKNTVFAYRENNVWGSQSSNSWAAFKDNPYLWINFTGNGIDFKANPGNTNYQFELDGEIVGNFGSKSGVIYSVRDLEETNHTLKVSLGENTANDQYMDYGGVTIYQTPAKEDIDSKVQELKELVQSIEQAGQGNYTQASWQTIQNGVEVAKPLMASDSVELNQINDVLTGLEQSVKFATEIKETVDYSEIGIPVGEEWLDSEGNLIQAHGGGFLQQTAEDGKPIYYWVGENKIHNGASFYAVTLYSSRDLVNWTNEGNVLDYFSKTVEGAEYTLRNSKVERPKIIYNEENKQYVIWGHWEESGNYGSSQIVVATADNAAGPYTVLGHWRPGSTEKNWRSVNNVGTLKDEEYFNDNSDKELIEVDGDDHEKWGYTSRDMTVFVDDGIAYLIHAENHDMRIQQLNADYTDVDPNGLNYSFYQGVGREAPAIVKVPGNGYYMISSGQSGWLPNQSVVGFTEDLTDPDGWSQLRGSDGKLIEEATFGNNTSYYSQPTNIMTITNAAGEEEYVYMGDRWNQVTGLKDSAYVWLPLTIDTKENTASMDYFANWKLDVSNGTIELPENEKLVSRDKKVFGDGEDPERPTSFVTDGYNHTLSVSGDNTHWYRPAGVPFEVTIDLEKAYDLSRIDISTRQYNGSEMYYQYKVYGSNDNENWTEIADNSANRWSGFTSSSLEGNYRYVKYAASGVKRVNDNSNGAWAAGIVEIEVFANVAKTDKSELEKLYMTEIEKEREEENYPAELWQQYQQLLKETKDALNNDAITQDEIDQLTGNLSEVIEKLDEVDSNVEATDITLSANAIEVLKAKKTLSVTATFVPENATDQEVIWSIADENIVIMEKIGEFKGLKPGITKVTATTSNGITSTFTIRVTR